MNKTVKWLGLSVVALLLILVIAKVLVGRNADEIRVKVAPVKRLTIKETVSATGRLYPVNEVRVGAGLSGEVTELLVQEGDAVKKGDVVARIRTDGNRSSIDLSSLTGVSQSVPVGAAGRVITLKAPISGVVSLLNTREGERAGGGITGGEVMRIADMSAMELRADVSESDVIRVKRGDIALVQVDAYSGKTFPGKVVAVANSSRRPEQNPFSSDMTSYEVRIALDTAAYQQLRKSDSAANLPFRSGMNAKADIETREKANTLAVPVSAVTARREAAGETGDETNDNVNAAADGEEIVFVVGKDGKAASRVVKTGIQDINYFEITSGLEEGEQVITGPYATIQKLLPEGKKVKIVSRAALYRDKNE